MSAYLPGYYFDASKNRYFKITANHIAQGSSATCKAKYTDQAVQAEKALKQDEQREKLLKASRDAVTVKRSKLLQHPLLDFEARLGNRKKSPGRVAKEFYAASLGGRPAIHPNPFRHQTGLGPICDKFSVSKGTGLLTTVVKGRGRHETDSFGQFQPSEYSDSLYPQGQTVPTLFGTSQIDHILPLGHGVNVWVYRSYDPVSGDVQSRTTLTVMHQTFPENEGTANEGVGIEYRLKGMISDLAATPNNDTFAAAEEKEVTIRWPGRGTSFSLFKRPQGQNPNRVGSKPTSVWFKDNNVLLFGARSGWLRFADLRFTRQFDQSVLRMQHDSAISHIRTIGPHQVLVHGLKSTSLYDLRWCPDPEAPNTDSHRSSKTTLSQAYLTFNVPETRRQNRYGLGFAYDPELNVVLSASTDFHNNHRVSLWDASTGQLLQSPLCDHTFEQPVTCAQVVDLRPQAKSFLLASNGVVQEWCPL